MDVLPIHSADLQSSVRRFSRKGIAIMSFTAACYTRGCGWKKSNAKDAGEAHRWGQWHAVEMKLKSGQGHETNFFFNEDENSTPPNGNGKH